MVQGCDVWLNTPRRPLEASGTSGMKAVANGGLHLSTLDGWWDEAWSDAPDERETIGWAIGHGQSYVSEPEQDALEAEILYELLEHDVVPTFYERDAGGLPRRWIARMKASIGSLCHRYNSNRMVWEYLTTFYAPIDARARRLRSDEYQRARALAAYRARLQQAWPAVRVRSASAGVAASLRVGDPVAAQVWVELGELSPEDVLVEAYAGGVDPDGNIVGALHIPLRLAQSEGQGVYRYEGDGKVPYRQSGLHGYTIRVLPAHSDFPSRYQPGLITWAGPDTLSN
jgi:starch phosphorylase